MGMNDYSAYAALARFEEENIPFPPFSSALNAIEEHLVLFRRTGIAKHLLVLGESGTGKSTLCSYLVHQYPREVLPDRDVVPVVCIQVPAAATIGSVATEILLQLGDPSPTSGSVLSKTHRIIALCRGCRVELMLVDEAQHMYDRGRQSTHYLVGDWIKRLIDDLKIPTVFLGLPRFEQLLQVNEQLRRRFSRRLWLAMGQPDGSGVEMQCLELFVSLGSCLPIPVSYSAYPLPEFSQRLYFACDGRVAYIKRLLHTSLRRALFENLAEITAADLEVAFERDIWGEGIGRLNPFHKDFDFRRLDRAGEPFERGACVRARG
jgi:hypothetical protein